MSKPGPKLLPRCDKCAGKSVRCHACRFPPRQTPASAAASSSSRSSRARHGKLGDDLGHSLRSWRTRDGANGKGSEDRREAQSKKNKNKKKKSASKKRSRSPPRTPSNGKDYLEKSSSLIVGLRTLQRKVVMVLHSTPTE